jgi:RNA polymerase sigma factor (sigma-70 family)
MSWRPVPRYGNSGSVREPVFAGGIIPVAAPLGCGGQGCHEAQIASAVISQYEGFIRAVIRFFAHNACEEEELYQDLFLVLMCDKRLPYVENVKSYLYQMIARDAIDAARWATAEHKRQKKFLENAEFPVYSHAPDFALITAEEVDGVLKCAKNQLKHKEAVAVTLMYREGCTVPEIARRMGVKERTVHRYLSAALQALRRIWKH